MEENKVTPERLQIMKHLLISLLEDQEKIKITITKEETIQAGE